MSATASRLIVTVAPHRLLFSIGALNLLLAMAWWTGWIAHLRLGIGAVPLGDFPGGSLHALVMPYLVLGPFIFGFLFTVFPRWMPVAPFERWHYVPSAGCLLAAQVLLLASAWLGRSALTVAAIVGLAGWVNGAVLLLHRLLQDRTGCLHARVIALAVGAGVLGWLLFVAHLWTGEPGLLLAARRIGVLGLLLPVFLAVAHRMFPFFAQCVDPAYRPWRPAWWAYSVLLASWSGAVLELLGVAGGAGWAGIPLFFLGLLWCWRTWPAAGSPFVLRALFLGMLWMPAGAWLLALHAVLPWWTGAAVPFNAALHAWTVGMFGSLLVAMVSRVSRGHSGRPITMNAVDIAAFWAIQVVAVWRIAAEWAGDVWLMHGLGAALWVLVLTPWLVQHLGYWLAPRIDGKPG